MSASPTGLRNFSKMNDKDKAYIVKLLGIISAAALAGIISGTQYDSGIDGITSGRLGFLIWFTATLGFSVLIKFKYDLKQMSDIQIFRHGVFVGFLSFLFFWTVVFNFIQFSL